MSSYHLQQHLHFISIFWILTPFNTCLDHLHFHKIHFSIIIYNICHRSEFQAGWSISKTALSHVILHEILEIQRFLSFSCSNSKNFVIAVTNLGQFNSKHLRQSTCQALEADFFIKELQSSGHSSLCMA